MITTCPSCGAEKKQDPIADGEILRATNCPECGEWFRVDEG